MSQKIAFLGLGVMGAPMTVNLVRQGFAVNAWNRTPEAPGITIAGAAGANICSNIAAAVRDAEIVFTCVGDVPDVEAVIFRTGGCHGIGSGGNSGGGYEYHWLSSR
jgi:3-hydroxyisobutyrate dehydrogenase